MARSKQRGRPTKNLGNPLCLRLSDPLDKWLRKTARKENQSIKSIVEAALKEKFQLKAA